MKKPHIVYRRPMDGPLQQSARRFQADVGGCWWNEAGEPTAAGIMESRRLYDGLDRLEREVGWRGWQGWPR